MLTTTPPYGFYPDLDGSPLDAGKVYFGQPGQDAEASPITVYWDSAGTQPAAQPIRTRNGFLVRNGAPAVVYAGTDYSTTVRDKNGVLVVGALTSADFNVSSLVQGLRADLTSSGTGKGGALVGVSSDVTYPPGTVGERFAEYVSITEPRFGGAAGGSWHAAIASATAYCESRDIGGDAEGPYGGVCLVIPRGVFPITANAPIFRNVICFGQITGAFDLTISQRKRINHEGLRCYRLVADGIWFIDIRRMHGAMLLKGGGVGFGSFWGSIDQVGRLDIDLSNWSVNQLCITGRGGVFVAGSGGLVLDGHGLNLDHRDLTPTGYSNTASVQQTSIAIGTYYEAGADIDGDLHMFGFQGDANGPPKVRRHNHILASFHGIEKNGSDFIAAGSRNILQGGEWDYLDDSGKPPCLSAFGVTGSVVADATEPFGMKYRYEANFAGAFTGFAITVSPCRSGRFSMVVAYRGDDFASIEVARGGGSTTSGGGSVVSIDPANNWKLLRISGNASQTASTTVNLFALTAAGSKYIAIGGMYATQEKAALLPSAQIVREQQGTVSQAYVSGAGFVDVSVTFGRPFAAGTTPTVLFSVVNSAAQTPNMTKSLLQSVSNTGFTVRVYYATDWAGQINWNARGLD